MLLAKKLCHVSYDGTNYHGFSISIGKITIQQIIEETLARIICNPGVSSHIDFSSRTDAGVHAFDQLITFYVPEYFESNKLQLILNQRLPSDIRIQSLSDVEDSFNLRDKIKAKVYQYTISNEVINPFKNRYVWTMFKLPDLSLLNCFLKTMVGEHDFSVLAKESYRYSSTLCQINKIECFQTSLSEICIQIQGDRFLYNMVRRMVGFAVHLTIKNKPLFNTFEELVVKYKSQTNMRAPSCGLVLLKVILDAY